jgi:hypothetical protein
MSAAAQSTVINPVSPEPKPKPKPNLLTIPQELRNNIISLLIEGGADKIHLCDPPHSDKLTVHNHEHCNVQVSIYKIQPWIALKHTNRQLFDEITAELGLANPVSPPALKLCVRSLECLNRLNTKLPPDSNRRVSMVFFEVFLTSRWNEMSWWEQLRDYLWARLNPRAQGWGSYYEYDVQEKRLVEADETEEEEAGQFMRGHLKTL